MKPIKFPNEVTTDNFDQLIEIGTNQLKLKKWNKVIFDLKEPTDIFIRYFLAFFLFVFLTIAGLAIAFSPELITTEFVDYSELQMNYFIVLTIVSFLISCYVGIFKAGKISNWLVYNKLNITKPEYELFREFAFIADNISKGNRRKSTRRLSYLREKISIYLKVNSDLKRFINPELSVLQNIHDMGRLVLYSKTSNVKIANFFLNLGLKFVHHDYNSIYSSIKKLETLSKKYHYKNTTKKQKIIDFLKMTEYLKNLIVIILLISSVLAWIFWGIQLNIPSAP